MIEISMTKEIEIAKLRMIWLKEAYKYFGRLKVDTIKQMEMRE